MSQATAVSVPHAELGEQDGPLRSVHIAVGARTLHDRTRERELDDVEVGDVEPLHELAWLLKERGYSLGSQRTPHLFEDVGGAAEYIDGNPEWSSILGANLQHPVAEPRHARPRRRRGERLAWGGQVPSHD